MIGRVAVVDGFGSGRFLAHELADRGAECFHVRGKPTYNAYLEATFSSDDYALDLGYDEDQAAVAARLLELGVEHVVAGNESGVLIADALAHAAGLPCNAPEHSAARRDKHLMAERLREVGLAAPAGVLAHTPAEAVRWFEAGDFDSVVVKPIDSAGSDNVRFCRTSAEVEAACAAVLGADNVFGSRNRAVVQEALSGPEFYVNTVSIDGRHLIAETWRYTKQRTADNAPLFDFEEPADLAAPDTQAVHAYVAQALDALGIRFGAAHSEVVLTSQGPVLIDPGARLGGGVQPWVAEKFLGYSHAGLLATSIVDPAAALAVAARAPHAWPQPIRYVSLINRTPGIAGPTTWTAWLGELNTALAVTPVAAEGSFLPQTHDLGTSPGYVYLSGPDQAEIEADYHRIRAWEHNAPYTRAA